MNVYGRRVAPALCACFLLISSLSAVLSLVYADHEHDHDGEGGCCSVCEQIAFFQDLSRRLAPPSSEKTEWKAGVVARAPVFFYSWIYFSTLATLKMRMNS